MTEILFRGKRADNGNWVKGFYSNELFANKHYISNWYYGSYAELQTFEVIPETVGQYTGLTDKNGTKIFEGDIVRTKHYGKVIKNMNVNDYDIFKVIYTYAMYRAENKNRAFNLVDGRRYEVIGNITDNPELLKGDKE